MFETINAGQISYCQHLRSDLQDIGNDWGFYVDIEMPFSQYKETYYTNLYKIDEEQCCQLNEDNNMFLYKLLKFSLIVTISSYCFSIITYISILDFVFTLLKI